MSDVDREALDYGVVVEDHGGEVGGWALVDVFVLVACCCGGSLYYARRIGIFSVAVLSVGTRV